MDAPDESAYPTSQQRRILWNALTALAVTALLGVAALVFYGFISFLSWSYPILLPIGLALIIALFLEPFVAFVQKRGMQRGTATLLVCLLAAVGFLLFWAYLVPPLVTQASGFFNSLPATINDGLTKLQATMTSPSEVKPDTASVSVPPLETNQASALSPETNSMAFSLPATNQPPALPSTLVPPKDLPLGSNHSEIQNWLKANLPALLQRLENNLGELAYSALGPVGQAFGFILGFGFVPIYVYYFLADQEQIAGHWHELVPLRRSRLRDEVVSVLAEINASLVSYFRGQIIVAACNGLLTVIGLWLIGVPYSLVLGIITGALSIVPFLGIIASIIPALLLGFLSAKSDPTLQWLRPLLVVGVFAGVQLCESMFITPRVQSHSTGLHPLIIILGILFWSLLLPGLLGPIVAVPLTCAVVVLLRRYVWQEQKAE